MEDEQYPDNLLKFDRLNTLFGGAPKNAFGGRAWEFIHGLVRDLAAGYLAHSRVSSSTQAPITQEAIIVGDCMAMDFNRTLGAEPYIGKLSTIGAQNGAFIGVAAEPAGAGARFRLAASGPVPARITGLTSTPARTPVTVDLATNKLRPANTGELAVGLANPQGNVLLFGPGKTG